MTILLRLSIRPVIRRLVATDDDLPDLGKATSEMAHISSKFDNPVSEFIRAWLASSRHGGSLAVSKVNGCPPTSVHQRVSTKPGEIQPCPDTGPCLNTLRVGSGSGSALAQSRLWPRVEFGTRLRGALPAREPAGSVCRERLLKMSAGSDRKTENPAAGTSANGTASARGKRRSVASAIVARATCAGHL